jgi:hypothetical protein
MAKSEDTVKARIRYRKVKKMMLRRARGNKKREAPENLPFKIGWVEKLTSYHLAPLVS